MERGETARVGLFSRCLLVTVLACVLPEQARSNSDSHGGSEGSRVAELVWGTRGSARSHVGRRLLQDESGVLSHVSKRRTRPSQACWAKLEQSSYLKNGPSWAPSQYFLDKLKAYAEMHKRCTADVSNWEDFFVDGSHGVKEGSDVSSCKYLVFESPRWHGVGNRIMGLVSAITLGMLTDRALLIEDVEFLGQALCNPFPDSTWRMPEKGFRFVLNTVKTWSKDPDKANTIFDLHISWDSSPWEILCEEKQKEWSTRRFGLMYSDFYLVPALYLHSQWKEELQKMFPDARAFMHLSRHWLFPENHLWDIITRTHMAYLRQHNVKIGLQIRETHETGVGLMGNVMDCLVNKSKLLAEAVPVDQWRDTSKKAQDEALLSFPRKSSGIFLTSLNGKHSSLLRDWYTRGKPVDGSAVSVYTLSHYNKEMSENYAHYESALVEMWLLAFCDSLLITDHSTFGYVASGLSGTEPYMLNVAIRGNTDDADWRKNGRPSCVPSFSEPCQVADVRQQCATDQEPFLAADTPLLQRCPGVNRFVMVAPPK